MQKRLIRISGFVGKEVRELARQPRLLLSLLLGPFLILLIFGAGYVGTAPRLRVVIVVPNTPAFAGQDAAIRAQFSKGVDVIDLTRDLNAAQNRLRNGGIDAVIAVPGDAAEKIGAGAQAIVPVYYNEIDPISDGRIVLGTLQYTNDLNKETVASAFKQGQQGAGNVNDALARMDTALGRISDDLGRGQVQDAQGQITEVRSGAGVLALSAGLMLQLLQTAPVAGPQSTAQQQNLTSTRGAITSLNSDIGALQSELAQPAPDPVRVRDHNEAIRSDLRTLQGVTTQFQQMNAYVLAAPFYGQAENLARDKPTFLNFYTPGVLALLLQHIAVTLGALSMVRERLLGSIELFRVSPITPGEILTGKYIGFTLFLAVLAVLLVALSIFGLGVPMAGDWFWLAGSLLLVILASLGLGFALSMISKTESQAVQLAMLTLLTSVFFSGFFLALNSFIVPVQYAAYSLPVTHGIISLQTIMLRGRDPDLFYPLMLGVLTVLFAAFSMWRFSREFRRG